MSDEDGLEIGEIRIDEGKATLLMNKSTDPCNRRWALNLEIELLPRTSGVIAQKQNELKLTTMVDARVTCIAKNYKVDDNQRKKLLEDVGRKQTMEFEAPPLD